MTVAASGWVIERYINSVVHYWTGKGEGESNGNFTQRHDDALRLARDEDAQVILCRMCAGNGRIAQHAWVDVDYSATASVEVEAAIYDALVADCQAYATRKGEPRNIPSVVFASCATAITKLRKELAEAKAPTKGNA